MERFILDLRDLIILDLFITVVDLNILSELFGIGGNAFVCRHDQRHGFKGRRIHSGNIDRSGDLVDLRGDMTAELLRFIAVIIVIPVITLILTVHQSECEIVVICKHRHIVSADLRTA